jgi:hypothetical protein
MMPLLQDDASIVLLFTLHSAAAAAAAAATHDAESAGLVVLSLFNGVEARCDLLDVIIGCHTHLHDDQATAT